MTVGDLREALAHIPSEYSVDLEDTSVGSLVPLGRVDTEGCNSSKSISLYGSYED